LNAVIELTNSTYSGYLIIIPKISYLSKVRFNNKSKEYYFEIGYESSEYTKFILAFQNEGKADIERQIMLEKINQYYK